MSTMKLPRFSKANLSEKAFFTGVIGCLTAGIPVCYAFGVEDLSGVVGVTRTWLLMGSVTFFAMKKAGAFR